jgi:hypothetical protein
MWKLATLLIFQRSMLSPSLKQNEYPTALAAERWKELDLQTVGKEPTYIGIPRFAKVIC